jgi:multidrug efflux system membrane fusion protein
LLGAAAFGAYRIYENLQASKQKAAAAQARAMAPRAVPVSGVAAHGGDMPMYLRGLGNVTAFNTVVVRSRVDGQLMSIHYTEGQFVKEGDLLAEIDPRPFQVMLDQAKGQLARDQAQLNDAKVNLSRYQALWNEQVIAKQQLDTQAATVGQFEGAIESDKAAIGNAQLQLTYSKITAPLSGRIGLRQVDVGNIVHASDQNGLASIAQMQPIAVLFTIPADNLQPVLQKLRAGAQLPVYAYDRDDVNRIASGLLLTVDNTIDPTTGTSRLKAQFANSDFALFPNQFVNCRLLLDVKRGLTIIPAAAIQRGPQGAFVFVAQNGVARIRPVTTSITESGETAVEGVTPGEMVITDGQDKLQDNAKVDVRAPAGRGRQGQTGAQHQGGNQERFVPGQNAPAGGPPTGPARGQSMGPGQGFAPGAGAAANPQQQHGAGPSRGPGQGAPWQGPGAGGPRPEGGGRHHK